VLSHTLCGPVCGPVNIYHYREALAKEKEKIALEKEQNWLKQIPLKSMID
jgi:hypothetical protein